MPIMMDRPATLRQQSCGLFEVEPEFSGVLRWSAPSLSWLIFFSQGRIVFASHTVDPLERLERHLKRLSHHVTTLTRQVCGQARQYAESISLSPTGIELTPDYLAICWMIEHNLLTRDAARKLVAWISEEVVLNLLLHPVETLRREAWLHPGLPDLGQLEVPALLALIQRRLQSWQALGPDISSPYQRPYFASQAQAERLPLQQQKRLSPILRGFNFRQLSALLNQDELLIAKHLHPLISEGILVLRDPQAPFDRLPKTYQPLPDLTDRESAVGGNGTIDPASAVGLIEFSSDQSPQKLWSIACIDDSQAMLSEISRLLDGQNLEIHALNDSLKALMKLTTLKPDLILLDVGMPHVDGYQLCALIRKSSVLRDVPVVMVTGHKGLIDRVKARMVGASDYLTKPFTQEELLKIVFRYLS